MVEKGPCTQIVSLRVPLRGSFKGLGIFVVGRGPCTQIVYTLALKCLYSHKFTANVYII